MSSRNDIIEEVAVMLARSYPDNVSINAFCAAVRSMKTKTIPNILYDRDGNSIYQPEEFGL